MFNSVCKTSPSPEKRLSCLLCAYWQKEGPSWFSLYTGVDVSPVALDQARVGCPDGVFVEANIADWREDRKWGYARKKSDEELATGEQLKARLIAAAAVTKRHGLEMFPVPIEIPPDLNQVDWKSTLDKGLARNAEAHRKTLEPPG